MSLATADPSAVVALSRARYLNRKPALAICCPRALKSLKLKNGIDTSSSSRQFLRWYIAKRLNFDDIIYMSYSIDFRGKVIFTMEEEGL
ncbi:hypothetical protein, partial [Arsenophonus endosymbiont of Bemisia tabaci]|uniref:hypothetical protein n=1 Tax=Arsenophonus endosymbiont of Bemisia tabaci TaxID=536059 RepID=UPI0015F3DD49